MYIANLSYTFVIIFTYHAQPNAHLIVCVVASKVIVEVVAADASERSRDHLGRRGKSEVGIPDQLHHCLDTGQYRTITDWTPVSIAPSDWTPVSIAPSQTGHRSVSHHHSSSDLNNNVMWPYFFFFRSQTDFI